MHRDPRAINAKHIAARFIESSGAKVLFEKLGHATLCATRMETLNSSSALQGTRDMSRS
jgi:hypothetical protein